VLAFVFGWLAFRSRVTGVYLSIITQALTYALMLAFFRNEMGFGGNNGLTDFKDILGFNLQADSTRIGCSSRPASRWPSATWPVARWSNHASGGSRRDPRHRGPDALHRLQGRARQACDLHLLGDAGRARRCALRAAGRHHQPG
jgi:hypothetical protein